jgi:hypothetical protein
MVRRFLKQILRPAAAKYRAVSDLTSAKPPLRSAGFSPFRYASIGATVPKRNFMKQHALARNLAVFSLGLGLAELLAPRKVARLIGVSEEHERLLQALGLREIASGLGILQGNPAHFLWSRVAGDAMDLALLAAARRSERSDGHRIGVAMVAVAGATALDLLAALLHSRNYAQPEWRDARPMETRGGLLRADAQALHSTSGDGTGDLQPSERSTISEELTEATSPSPSAG